MNWRPTQDCVIVRQDDGPEKSPGGILIPATAADSMQKGARMGRVVAVGPGRLPEVGFKPACPKRNPDHDGEYEERQWVPGVKPGDLVVYGQWAGVKFRDPESGEDFTVMAANEILAVAEEAHADRSE